MTKVHLFHPNLPTVFNRNEFLMPFDRLFDDLMESTFPELHKQVGVHLFENNAYPRVNVMEYDDKINIIAEIPGLKKDQLSIDVENGILTISGNKHQNVEDNAVNVIRRELKHSSFKRTFGLSDNLNANNVSAAFENGILTINIPKIEPDKSAKKTVKIA